jgi:hypothetical protein
MSATAVAGVGMLSSMGSDMPDEVIASALC